MRSHYTLGYSFIRDNLLRFNHHRQVEEDNPECEFETLFRHYSDVLFALDRKIVDADPFDIVDDIFDESRERFWASLKLYEISTAYRYPTYFQIDRDIIHGAAYRTATELSIPLEPQTPDDVIHDLWDESRFSRSRSVKTEELLERLVEFGADGIRTFYETVAEEVTYGLNYVTASRYDNIHTGFDELLGSYTGAEHARAPGSTIADSRILYRHLLKLKRPAAARGIQGAVAALAGGKRLPDERDVVPRHRSQTQQKRCAELSTPCRIHRLRPHADRNGRRSAVEGGPASYNESQES